AGALERRRDGRVGIYGIVNDPDIGIDEAARAAFDTDQLKAVGRSDGLGRCVRSVGHGKDAGLAAQRGDGEAGPDAGGGKGSDHATGRGDASRRARTAGASVTATAGAVAVIIASAGIGTGITLVRAATVAAVIGTAASA